MLEKLVAIFMEEELLGERDKQLEEAGAEIILRADFEQFLRRGVAPDELALKVQYRIADVLIDALIIENVGLQ